jgi:hypothetical protein
MKKYLMTALAAVALGAAFVSCSHSEDLSGGDTPTPKPDPVSEQKAVELAKSEYANLFEKTFGKVGKDVDWGFSSGTAATRGTRAAYCDKDAHMWVDKGYDVPVELSEAQKQRVIAYFQHNTLTAGGSKDWTDFFIQQVYKGGTSPIGNKETPNGYSPEEYHCANGGWTIGGSQMDYLTSNGDDHIYDYNSGDCSEIGNVQSNPGVEYLYPNGTGYHKDKIRLMTGSLASNFGYHNSNADKTYNDKYVLVEGSVIDNWAKTSGNNVGASVSGRSFVGFDFEQFYKEEDIYTGSWSFGGKNYKYVVNAPNKYCGYIEKFNDSNKPEAVGTVQEWLDNGYLPVYNTAGKEWAKVIKCADGYFSDWIVCIAPGHKEPEPKQTFRVIAEDLNANTESSDWDFNDVIFDVNPNEDANGNYLTSGGTIQVLCAGGIYKLEIIVGGQAYEVHALFGQSKDETTGKYPMINTGADVNGLTATTISTTTNISTPTAIRDNIILKVYKPGFETNGATLDAVLGEPACKVLVDKDYNPLRERKCITDQDAYPNFSQYIQGGNAYSRGEKKWWKE